MSKSLKISIPHPCNQDWNQMTPNERGRFCNACQKDVTDFTTLSDREISAKLATTANICGRLRVSQLDRQLDVPKEKSTAWVAAASGILTLIGANNVHAQTAPQIPTPTVQTSDKDSEFINPVLPTDGQLHAVSGVVSDEIGPIPGVTVKVLGSDRSTESDLNGQFEIKAKQGDRLLVHSLGLLDAEYVITDHLHNIQITLTEDPAVERIIGGGICVHRTFFGRIFHSIGNWFR